MVALADKTNTTTPRNGQPLTHASGSISPTKTKASVSLGAPVKHKEVSSFKVFMEFVEYKGGKVDAAGILSTECYQKWIMSRRKHPLKPQEAFRRALTAHCRGVDGRRPFPEKVEESLLVELRKKQRWKCFESYNDGCGKIGIQGFPSLGYHERKNKEKKRSYMEAQAVQDVKRARYNNYSNYAATYPPRFDGPSHAMSLRMDNTESENDAAIFNQVWSNSLELFDSKKSAYSNCFTRTTMPLKSEPMFEFDQLIEDVIDPGMKKESFLGSSTLLPGVSQTCGYEETRLDDSPELSQLIEEFLL